MEDKEFWAHYAQEFADQLGYAIKLIAQKQVKAQIVIGRAVNVGDLLCDIDRGEDSPMIHGARLNALEEQTGTYKTVVPKEGSWVLAAVIENDHNEAVIITTTEVEKIIGKCGEQTTHLFTDGTVKYAVGDNQVEITGDKVTAKFGEHKIELTAGSIISEVGSKSIKIEDSVITLNGGLNGSMIIIQALIDRINRLEQKCDDLVTKHNGLESSYNAHTHAYLPGPAGPTAATAIPIPVSANTGTSIGAHTTIPDIENPEVKH